MPDSMCIQRGAGYFSVVAFDAEHRGFLRQDFGLGPAIFMALLFRMSGRHCGGSASSLHKIESGRIAK